MTILNVQEATALMHSYGIKCDQEKVKQWIKDGTLMGSENDGSYQINEEDVHTFLELYRWAGTAYEEGIDDQTKISRLLDEIADLKQQVSRLQEEKARLESQLGIAPF